MAMVIGSVFENNRTQAVRLPKSTRFSDDTKKVMVRVVGEDRILSPVNRVWDSFFLSGTNAVTDDFMEIRGSQEQSGREAFDD